MIPFIHKTTLNRYVWPLIYRSFGPYSHVTCWTISSEGLFTWREEDPGRRKNFRWVSMQSMRSLWCPSREGIKDDRRQQQKCKDPSALFTGINREIKIHVYDKRQTSDSSQVFLRIENKQIKTVPKNSYGYNWHETTYFCVEVINGKRQLWRKLGHVVQIYGCRLA